MRFGLQGLDSMSGYMVKRHVESDHQVGAHDLDREVVDRAARSGALGAPFLVLCTKRKSVRPGRSRLPRHRGREWGLDALEQLLGRDGRSWRKA